MDQYQKKVLIIVFSILIFIAFVAVIWSLFISDDANPPITPPEEPGGSENEFTTDIIALNDYDEFFTVSRIINNYYEDVVSRNTRQVLDLLDVDYKAQMGIQANNVFQIIESDYHSVTYTPMEVYYNAESVVTYYFVSGYLEDVDITDDSSRYYDPVNFLVIVNKNTKHYSITPLSNSLNISNYALEYELVLKDLENNTYEDVRTAEESILITYLNVFRDLLYLDNERAYQMLSDDTKELYFDSSDFLEHQEEIYNYVPSTVFGYSKEEEGEQVIYTIVDEHQNQFVIYENKVMDFQISY